MKARRTSGAAAETAILWKIASHIYFVEGMTPRYHKAMDAYDRHVRNVSGPFPTEEINR